jgi:nitroreductase
MDHSANPGHSIHEILVARWSPYSFQDRPVPEEDLQSLFEAARWAASSYNEQPWSFILATREESEAFRKAVSCLVEQNQQWASEAPVLVLCCTRTIFSMKEKPNPAAIHDLGLAAAGLTFEATARGLHVHQMIGIRPEKVRELYEVPEEIQPVTAMAIGYVDSANRLPEMFKERELAPRTRKPLSDILFSGKWGETSSLAK